MAHAMAASPGSRSCGSVWLGAGWFLIDGAMVETIGSILKTSATDDELKAVFEDLSHRMEVVGRDVLLPEAPVSLPTTYRTIPSNDLLDIYKEKEIKAEI